MSDYPNVPQQISDPISENLANGDIADRRFWIKGIVGGPPASSP
jgi:hypothetical protein